MGNEKPKINFARFSVQPDERGLLLGVDKAGIFEKGVVYEAREMLGQIILKSMGKYALPAKGSYPSECSDANEIIYSGIHLLTKDEWKSIQEKRNRNND